MVGRKIGELVKIDAYTSSTLRVRYARICVQIPMEAQLKTSIIIGSHKQVIYYEGDDFLCKACGFLGHIAPNCSKVKPEILKEPVLNGTQAPTERKKE